MPRRLERNGQHETDKTVSVEIMGAVTRGVEVVEFAPMLKIELDGLKSAQRQYGQSQFKQMLRRRLGLFGKNFDLCGELSGVRRDEPA